MDFLFRPKRQKTGLITLLFLLIFGGIFCGVGLNFISQMSATPGWSKTEGKVIDFTTHRSNDSTTYSPVVEYYVEGKRYLASSNISSPTRPTAGSTRDVSFDPIHPGTGKVIETGSNAWFMWIFPVVGASIMLGGAYSFIRSTLRSKAIRQLTQNGHKLDGILVEVQDHGGKKQSIYKLVVAAVDPTGQTRHFLSDPVIGAAGIALADFKSDPIAIDVFIDASNPDNYYVDIDDIPALTPERISALVQSAKNRQATEANIIRN
jgi:hypothetical protein